MGKGLHPKDLRTRDSTTHYTGHVELVVEDFESVARVVLQPNRPPMTDDEFLAFCQHYPDFMVEATADGDIIIMPPAHPKTGRRNLSIGAQLYQWTKADGRGQAFDSSAGFVLPSGARRSPDASWIRKDRISSLPKEQQEGFYHLCPDFVIELRSTTDRLRMLQAKMEEYIANGAELGWLLDPKEQKVWVYRPNCEPEAIRFPESVAGEGCVTGFVLELEEIWA